MQTFEVRDPNFAKRVRDSFDRQAFMQWLGAELGEVAPGSCEIRLPFRTELTQQHGYVHAGAVGAIADSAGGYAAYTLMGAEDSVLSVEYKLNLLAPAVGDALVARARVVKAGRTLSVTRADVFAIRGAEETLVATMQQTVMRLEERPDR